MGFYVSKYGILHSHCLENLKSYTYLIKTFNVVFTDIDVSGIFIIFISVACQNKESI
jgi:hypothetical protein